MRQQLAWDRGGIIAEGESIGALDKRMILRRQNGEVEELFFRNLIHYRIEKIARKLYVPSSRWFEGNIYLIRKER